MKIFFTLFLLIIAANTFSQSITDTAQLKEIVVSAPYKVSKTTPFSFTNLDAKTITLSGREKEPVSVLQSTPSFTFNTDNGLFSGYCYYRLRGIDQTRINVSLNGVPLNEPEDQGIYFNNFPNFMQTISHIQIVRGVGVSKSGVSSYAGSINFDNFETSETEFTLSYGSFNTINSTANYNFKRGWIRASYLNTNGYKYHSGNKSGSVFYLFRPSKKSELYGFIGKQFNDMAWVGSPIDSIKNDRRYNANKSSEKDEFLYIHNQFHQSFKNINIILYHTYLNGGYNMDMGHFDGNFNQSFYKLNLKSNWIGTNVFVKIFDKTFFGVSAFTYKRNHDNLMAYPNVYESYNKNYGVRNEFSPYFKTNFSFKKLSLYGDLQYRLTSFYYNDITRKFDLSKKKWNFLNWSAGTTYKAFDKFYVYCGVGQNHREPTRTDMFGGYDEYHEESYSDIVPEEVIDVELGTKYYAKNLLIKFNVYHMNFKNEIVLNGQIGPNSIVIHSNVAKSHRTGAELEIKYDVGKWELKNSTNVSNNIIIQNDTTITHVLSPSLISSLDICHNSKTFVPGINLRYNGESYLDLSNQNKIPSYLTMDFFNSINFNNFVFVLRINNVFDKLYYTYGNIGFDGNPIYFQQAGRNFSITMSYKL